MEDSGLMQRPEIFTFAMWCLFRATFKKRKVLHGGQVIPLQPGQFIFGRKAAAEALGSTERKIRTALVTLSNMDFLTSKATNKYTIITIVNWGTYQNGDQPIDQQSDQVPTSKRPASDHKQELKEVKKEKNKILNTGDFPFDEEKIKPGLQAWDEQVGPFLKPRNRKGLEDNADPKTLLIVADRLGGFAGLCLIPSSMLSQYRTRFAAWYTGVETND